MLKAIIIGCTTPTEKGPKKQVEVLTRSFEN
jgi:hypothetical protein